MEGNDIPAVLLNQEILIYISEEINRLRKLENIAYRTILSLTKLRYHKYAMTESNINMRREIMRAEAEFKTEWLKTIDKYMIKTNITEEQLFTESNNNIRKRINEWDIIQWKEDMANKTTLNIYIEI